MTVRDVLAKDTILPVCIAVLTSGDVTVSPEELWNPVLVVLPVSSELKAADRIEMAEAVGWIASEVDW